MTNIDALKIAKQIQKEKTRKPFARLSIEIDMTEETYKILKSNGDADITKHLIPIALDLNKEDHVFINSFYVHAPNGTAFIDGYTTVSSGTPALVRSATPKGMKSF